MIHVCSKKMPSPFEAIGSEIYKKYIRARHDIPDQRSIEAYSQYMLIMRNSDNEIQRDGYQSTTTQYSSRRKRSAMLNVDELEFFEDSPNFCGKSRYFEGTVNRVCKNKISEEDYSRGMRGCREICCNGKSSRRKSVIEHTNCKFHYCCSVKCDEVEKTYREHYCSPNNPFIHTQ